MAALVKKMQSGAVTTLLILGGNPVYNAPADLAFAEALPKVKTSVHLSMYDDETSRLCTWHLARAHYMETWGDARTFDGTAGISPPLVELFDRRSAIECLSMLVDDKLRGGYEIVRDTAKSLVAGPLTEYRWKKFVSEGFIDGTAWKPVKIEKVENAAISAALVEGLRGLTPTIYYDLVFYTDKVHDGRFANNGWLQELPDPMTRLTWDNAAVMSPGTAKTIGIRQKDELVRLLDRHSGHEIVAPVFLMPGMGFGVIGVALGYGRTAAGHVGNGVGQDAYAMRTTAESAWRWITPLPTGRTHPLATVQDHHIVDRYGKEAVAERVPELVRELPLAKAFTEAKERPAKSIFDEHRFDGTSPASGNQDKSPKDDHDLHKWGMAIDLTACTGCGACVTACQAENNIPIVGKEQVLHGREMHWIRVDRYFRGEPDRGGSGPSARALHALRECSLRVGLPGGGDHAQPGRHQHDDLQPLCRHSLLLEQLPVQGAAIQFLRLQPRHAQRRVPAQLAPRAGDRSDQDAEEPRRDGADAGRDGEVQLLHPADRERADRRQARGRPPAPRRRDQDRLPADLPRPGDRLWRPERPEEPGLQAAQPRADLRHVGWRVEYEAAGRSTWRE